MPITTREIQALTESQQARFWAKVEVHGDDECWPWVAAKSANGYGVFMLRKGKLLLSHRVAWTEANGDIPDGLLICHKCDNRVCCNPSHMFTGTHRDNALDMMSKGRGDYLIGQKHYANSRPHLRRRGEKCPAAKLTESTVKEVRSRYDQGEALVSLARAFGVGSTAIFNIVNRKTWNTSSSTKP